MTAAPKFDKDGHWICPHGFVTGFFPVPGKPHLIEHRSCGICCDEIPVSLKYAGGEIAARKEIERLRSGYTAIMNAAVAGRICDDVAWFDGIETLYDFCDRMLNGTGPRDITEQTVRGKP